MTGATASSTQAKAEERAAEEPTDEQPLLKNQLTVIAKLRVPGHHRWPGAARVPGAEYLANKHRHLFHIAIEVTVAESDREIEFILLRDAVERWMAKVWPDRDFDTLSCEQLAERIGLFVWGLHQPAWVSVEVLEDGENGGRVVMF